MYINHYNYTVQLRVNARYIKDIFSKVMAIFRLRLFRKLFEHIIYGNIKTRYNVFRKYANDVFGERILQFKMLIL